jgi:hypothetical protein
LRELNGDSPILILLWPFFKDRRGTVGMLPKIAKMIEVAKSEDRTGRRFIATFGKVEFQLKGSKGLGKVSYSGEQDTKPMVSFDRQVDNAIARNPAGSCGYHQLKKATKIEFDPRCKEGINSYYLATFLIIRKKRPAPKLVCNRSFKTIGIFGVGECSFSSYPSSSNFLSTVCKIPPLR